MPHISVIIPVYKVEAFIGRCAESLLSQTMNEGVEFIFVDDASPDHSIEVLQKVLERHPERMPQCRIIRHEQNRGLPAARNTGLAGAVGEYIFHCDSDDFVEADMLETMYCTAIGAAADIVWCDCLLTFEQNERCLRQPSYTTAEDALKGMLAGAMKYNVWNKIARRRLYTENGIRFPDGHGMGEDMTMIRLMACAHTVAHVPKAFYHYVKTNAGAFTNTFSERQLADIRHNADETTAFLRERLGEKIEEPLAFFKLSLKYPFLFSGSRAQYELWRQWYPEANAYISGNRSVSRRARFIQAAAAKGQYWIVWLHYVLVYKIVYGIIYK